MIAIEGMEKLPENCHRHPFSYWVLNNSKGGVNYSGEPNENWCAWYNCTTEYEGARHRMSCCPLKEVEEA